MKYYILKRWRDISGTRTFKSFFIEIVTLYKPHLKKLRKEEFMEYIVITEFQLQRQGNSGLGCMKKEQLKIFLIGKNSPIKIY